MSKEKPVSELARTSISLPKSLYEKAMERARELHFANFSDYVQHLLRKEIVFRVEPPPPASARDRYPIKDAGESILVEDESAKIGKQKPAVPAQSPKPLPQEKRGIDKKQEN
jgi:hypothetical protein